LSLSVFLQSAFSYYYNSLFYLYRCAFFKPSFGLSRLTSLQFIQYHVAGFFKPTIPQSPTSHFQDYSICNNARLECSTNFVPNFDPNEWCLKNGLRSGCLNPGPLGHESSALTTRPRLLASISLSSILCLSLTLSICLSFYLYVVFFLSFSSAFC
jgi:hypothetical protein